MDFDNLWVDYNPSTYQQNNRCLSVNTILAGKYLVGPVLGQGGFGITYQGYDLNMETRIAIKEYFPVELVSRDTTTVHGDHVLSLSGEKSITYKQGLKKYVEEAQKVSQFSEVSGVVSVKDFFYENETAYIVMEYIEGESLKDYLKRKGGRLSEKETLFIMKPVIEALIKIHQAGIIHRDISPDNIMLTFDDTKNNSEPEKIKSIKLIDFGAARMTAKNDQKSLTIILKHGYAPEEQYRTHGEQGAWTDVYAICATMYRMLSGETPVPAMDRMFQDSLKSLDSFGIKISKNMQNTLIKGLAVKKEDRIQTMEELLIALYEGKMISSYRNTSKKATKIRLIASMMAVGIIAVCAVVYFTRNLTVPTEHIQEVVQEKTLIELDSENIAEEEVIGETIAYPHPQTSISGEYDHLLICLSDGTVKAIGANEFGQCNVEEWHDIVAVSAGTHHSLGLRSDGKVFAEGNNDYGECAVDNWSSIVQIATGQTISYGLTKEGTVVATGMFDQDPDIGNAHFEKIAQWKDIVAISSGGYNGIFALDKNGNVYQGLDIEWSEITGWKDVTQLIDQGIYLYGMKADGSMFVSKSPNINYELETLVWPNMKQLGLEIGISMDGTVVMQPSLAAYLSQSPDYEEISEELSNWTNMRTVWTSESVEYFVGVREDDTILEFRRNKGNSNLEDMKNLAWVNVGREDYIGFSDTLIAGTNDGKLLTYGSMGRLEQLTSAIEEYIPVEKIEKVITDNIIHLKDGRVYDYQDNVYVAEQVKNIIKLENYYIFMKDNGDFQIYPQEWEEDFYTLQIYEGLKQLSESNENLKIKFGSDTGVVLNQDKGTVSLCYKNERSEQRGIDLLSNWTDIQDIAVGKTHVVGLRKDGKVLAVGSNHVGQCNVEDWSDIVYIEAGFYCTLGITKDGELKIAGSL